MPINLCRHILPAGHYCNSPVIGKKTRYCFFHHRQRSLGSAPKRPWTTAIQLQFPEDRAAIQFNYQLVQQAVAEGRLEPRHAQVIICANRAAASNLKAGPLTSSSLNNRVERIIRTPDNEEVAPARQVCSPGENLTHGADCPCGYCAETYRNAPGELHHADCECGLCHEEAEGHDEAEEDEGEAPGDSAQLPAAALAESAIAPAFPSDGRSEHSEDSAFPFTQPQNHPYPHSSAPYGRHSERSEESAFSPAQPPRSKLAQQIAEVYQVAQAAFAKREREEALARGVRVTGKRSTRDREASEESAVPPAQPQLSAEHKNNDVILSGSDQRERSRRTCITSPPAPPLRGTDL